MITPHQKPHYPTHRGLLICVIDGFFQPSNHHRIASPLSGWIDVVLMGVSLFCADSRHFVFVVTEGL